MARVRPTGPFFTPQHLGRLQAEAATSIANHAPEIKGGVQAATPVGEPRKTRQGGTLRNSITTRVTRSKRGVGVTVRADATNESGDHYGVYREAHDPFMAEALVDAALPHIEQAIVDFVNNENDNLRAPR